MEAKRTEKESTGIISKGHSIDHSSPKKATAEQAARAGRTQQHAEGRSSREVEF